MYGQQLHETSWPLPSFVYWPEGFHKCSWKCALLVPQNKTALHLYSTLDSTAQTLAGTTNHEVMKTGHYPYDLGLQRCLSVLKVFVYFRHTDDSQKVVKKIAVRWATVPHTLRSEPFWVLPQPSLRLCGILGRSTIIVLVVLVVISSNASHPRLQQYVQRMEVGSGFHPETILK